MTFSGSYKDDPVPNFGHDLLKYWKLDAGYVNLNHGSYGSLPIPVAQACDELAAQIESNPDKFHRYNYQELSRSNRERLAKLIGAETDEVVLVPNTTHGVNTVLKNIDWKVGDYLIETNITYPAVSKTVQYILDVTPGLNVSSIDINAPTTHGEIFEKFRSLITSIKSSGDFSKPDSPKIVAVIDSIGSNPGIAFPWEKMVELCHQEGVLSLVDAAHSIGHQVDIDLSKTKPDFWISNCHKWLYVKRGCSALYVPKRNQHMILTSFPTSWAYVSPGSPNAPNFAPQFEWTGTFDTAPYLSINAALDFRQWLGGEKKINDYCRSLAISGGKRAAEILGTTTMDQTNDSELTLNMTNVKLPISVTTKDHETGMKIYEFLKEKMLFEHNCFAAPFFHNGAWWARFSAQVYNEISDFEYVANVLNQLSKEVATETGLNN